MDPIRRENDMKTVTEIMRYLFLRRDLIELENKRNDHDLRTIALLFGELKAITELVEWIADGIDDEKQLKRL